jgi:hypothetical protein
MSVNYNCGKCGSGSTQKISAIVSGGTSHGHSMSRATTVGMVDGNLAVANTQGSTNTTTTTALAQQLAKPARRTESWIFLGVLVGGVSAWAGGWIAGFLGGVLVSPHVGLMLGLIAAAWLFFASIKHYRVIAKRNAEYNKLEYPSAIQRWNLGFYCHRCEHVFVPDMNKDAVAS